MGMEKRGSKQGLFTLFHRPPRDCYFSICYFIGVPCGGLYGGERGRNVDVKTKSVYQSTIRFAKFGRALWDRSLQCWWRALTCKRMFSFAEIEQVIWKSHDDLLNLPSIYQELNKQKLLGILLTKACLTKDESQVTLNNMRILHLTQKIISSRQSLKVTVRVFVNLTETDVFVSCFSSYKRLIHTLHVPCAVYWETSTSLSSFLEMNFCFFRVIFWENCQPSLWCSKLRGTRSY